MNMNVSSLFTTHGPGATSGENQSSQLITLNSFLCAMQRLPETALSQPLNPSPEPATGENEAWVAQTETHSTCQDKSRCSTGGETQVCTSVDAFAYGPGKSLASTESPLMITDTA